MVGWDTGRLAMILAVLESRSGLALAGLDVYLNVVGGLKIGEPAADLAVAAALISSVSGVPVPPETPAEVDGNAMTPAETAEAPSIQELLTVDGFDYDKVVDYIDNSELGELKKASAKAALEAVRDTPEITQAALDQIKVLLGLEE